MSTRRVTITSDVNLEALLNQSGRDRGAVICHPHPLYGGSMDNNVVYALEEGFRLSGYSTLIFNFRGVGASEGAYEEGIGEIADVTAACDFMKEVVGSGGKLVLAGYSFGAWVASRAALRVRDLGDLVLVAYPFSSYDPADVASFKGRIYFVGGSSDDISPLDRLLPFYRSVATEKWLKVLPSTHFFTGVEHEIRDFVRQMFGPHPETAPQVKSKD